MGEREGVQLWEALSPIPSRALTDPHASLTLNVLVVYAINVVSAAPCVACWIRNREPAVRSIVAQTHLSTQSAPAP